MATLLKNAEQRPATTAKEERARDAALAMQEYEAEKLAICAKTARLRALRLAKEAEARERTSTKNADEDRYKLVLLPLRIDERANFQCVVGNPWQSRFYLL